MQALFRTLLLASLTLSLSACGWFSRDEDQYQMADSVPPLEIPPGLRSPDRQSDFEVPGMDGEQGRVTESFALDSNITESWRRVINALESMGEVSPRAVNEEEGRIELAYRGGSGSGNVDIVLVPDSVSNTNVRVSGNQIPARAVADGLRSRLVSSRNLLD
jgi:hypothetical protein